MRRIRATVILLILLRGITVPGFCDDPAGDQSRIRSAVTKSLTLLNMASAGSARQRKCFTCHSQAMPVLAMAEAVRRGISIDEQNYAVQIDHTRDFLNRSQKAFEDGKGTGGGVDTAGFALWTLKEGNVSAFPPARAVTEWILSKQEKDGRWKTTSNRPPSETSHFTTTFLALQALKAYGEDDQQSKIEHAVQLAATWLTETEPGDTEDAVFQLLAFRSTETLEERVAAGVQRLLSQQHENGGWAQTSQMEPDAYATGTVMYGLYQSGLAANTAEYQAAVAFLLKTQRDDGSWYVESRSDPFQAYYETGFPHGTDQFISTTATAWAAVSLLSALSESTNKSCQDTPSKIRQE